MPGQAATSDLSQFKPCPFCAEEVSAAALKCKHCGEFLRSTSRWQKLSTRSIALLGLATTVLSLFYALREGYYFIEQKQQQRAQLSSYRAVAEHFGDLDLLNYAQGALQKALSISPNDIVLQRQYFMLQAQDLLREIDWSGPDENKRPFLEQLILDGYRLLEAETEPRHKAHLLVMLARLLPQDMLWNDDEGVSQLFAEAYALQARDAEVAFRYGSWLVDMELDKDKGIALIQQAISLKPDDALYPYELANIYRSEKQYSLALPLFQQAIRLGPQQRELQRIRASNFSKTDLRRMFVEASKVGDFSRDGLLGLDPKQGRLLLEQLLEIRAADRQINFIAAQFYLAEKEYALAERAIKHTISDNDLEAQVPRGYYLPQFELYRDILKASGTDPAKMQAIDRALQDYQAAKNYEEVLDMGMEGEHNYKIGLKLVKRNDDPPGVEVREAYSGYPFARAGVVQGDRLIQLGHRNIHDIKTIFRIMSNFAPGTQLPLQISRVGQQLELSLQVE